MNGQTAEGKAEGSTNEDGPTVAQLNAKLDHLLAVIETNNRPPSPASYSVKAVAMLLGNSEYTVRDWVKNGRINAFRTKGYKSGKHLRLMIPAKEIDRYKAEGLLPPDPGRNRDRFGSA